MSETQWKTITHRRDKWEKISELAGLLSKRKGVNIPLPEAVDEAVTYYLTHLQEKK